MQKIKVAIAFALASAALFGFSTPAATVLLGTAHPIVLAGLLYSGAGLGVAVLRLLRRLHAANAVSQEAKLSKADAPWLAGAVLCGGLVGPVLLMVGLAKTDASATSLLLTLEG